MDPNKLTIASMALDLKRAAMSYYNGSEITGKRFLEEALKRKKEISENETKPYLKVLIDKIPNLLNQSDKMQLAEDALMYSTILQNYSTHNSE